MKSITLLFVSLCLTIILHAQISKTVDITPGNLKTVLTATELITITNLTVTGNMDARDFKTMRDDMPVLAVLDLTGVSLMAYTGTEGTSWRTNYPSNEFPEYAYWNENTGSKRSLVSLLFPSTMTVIGEGALSDCSGLTSITIPSSVNVIKQAAFSGCSSLTSVTIPSSVFYIGMGAFAYCSGLTSVIIPSSVKSIEYALFWDCSRLISIDIPSSVTSIGNSAFLRCNSLVSLTIPPTVRSIGESAFDGCSNWTGPLTLSPLVETIGKLAFNNCRSLTSVVLPSSLTSIGESAFNGCSGLTGILTIPSSVTSIGSWAFNNCSGLTGSIIIPPLVASIRNHTFSGCSGFTSLTIPSSVTTIGNSAFKGCSSLTSIDAHALFPVPLDYSFEVFNGVDKTNCTLNVPYGTRQLYESASQWKDFTTIITDTQGFLLSANTLNFEVNGGSNSTINMEANIGWTASADQPWLTLSPSSGNNTQMLTISVEPNLSNAKRTGIISFSAPGILPQTILVTQECFSNTITVTAGGLSAALTNEEKITLTNLTINGTIDARDFRTIRLEMPLLAELDLSEVSIVGYCAETYREPNCYHANSIPHYQPNYIDYSFSNKTSLKSIILPTSVTSIGAGAFIGCSGLTSIVMPSFLTSIGESAFRGCIGLSSINIPSSVNYIGGGAFTECSGLTSFMIPTGVASIEYGTFSDCSGLTSVNIPSSVNSIGPSAFLGCSQLPSIVIPPSVTSIGGGAFSNCSELELVILSSSLTTIGEGAFLGCSGFTSVNIPGSVNEIGQTAFFGCRNLTSIYVNRFIPVDLTSSASVFYEVNKTTCNIFVPYGSFGLYANAAEWKDFKNIIEMPGFVLSPTTMIIQAKQGSTTTAEIRSDVTWIASCDQSWLIVNPTSGIGAQSLIFTADANSASTTRTATVSVAGTGVDMQTITIVQEANTSNNTPVANAGVDQSVNEDTTVTLDGSGSSDADNDALTYLWTAPEGITLSSTTIAKPTFIAPDVKNDTVLIFSLIVNDGFDNSPSSEVKVMVKNILTKTEVLLTNGLKVFPNPTKGIIQVEGLQENIENMIAIYTMEGRLVKMKISSSLKEEIDISDQISGTYLLVINGNQVKIVKE